MRLAYVFLLSAAFGLIWGSMIGAKNELVQIGADIAAIRASLQGDEP